MLGYSYPRTGAKLTTAEAATVATTTLTEIACAKVCNNLFLICGPSAISYFTLDCPAEYCGAKIALAPSLCPDNVTYAGFTDKCLYNSQGDDCYWQWKECDNCSRVDCPQNSPASKEACASGEKFVKEGCCNRCVNCAAVSCLSVTCAEGTEAYIPEGSCCQSCRPKTSCGPVCAIYCPNGNVLDSNGCPTCECKPAVCPQVLCARFCPFGNALDSNGCPACQCKEDPACASIQCAACPPGTQAVPSEESCCGQCVSCSEPSNCPLPKCAAGYELKQVSGQCCPTCVPVTVCAAVLCPNIAMCPAGQVKVRGPCCEYCQNATACDNVRCFSASCPEGTKKVYPDGSCCPSCEPIPDCRAALCFPVKCEPGFEAVRKDLSCCATCEPIDRCATVRCARPQCHPAFWIKRAGECCPQCPTCSEDHSGRFKCDNNDNQVCKPGYFGGNNCTTPVPPSERTEVAWNVEVCPCPFDSADVKGAYVEKRVSELARVDIKYIESTPNSQASEGCCSFKVTVFNAKSSTDVVPEQAQATFTANVKSASDIRMAATGAASSLIASAIMVAFSVLVALAF